MPLNYFPLLYIFSLLPIFKQETLELPEKPLEEQVEGSKNGPKVVEIEPEVQAVAEVESQLIPAEGVPVPESVTLLSDADLQVPMKEDPAQSSQSESQLTSQDIRRAKRIRVSSQLHITDLSLYLRSLRCALQQSVSLPQSVLPSKMDVQVGGVAATCSSQISV